MVTALLLRCFGSQSIPARTHVLQARRLSRCDPSGFSRLRILNCLHHSRRRPAVPYSQHRSEELRLQHACHCMARMVIAYLRVLCCGLESTLPERDISVIWPTMWAPTTFGHGGGLMSSVHALLCCSCASALSVHQLIISNAPPIWYHGLAAAHLCQLDSFRLHRVCCPFPDRHGQLDRVRFQAPGL